MAAARASVGLAGRSVMERAVDRVRTGGTSCDTFRLPDPRDTIESGDVDGNGCTGVDMDMIEHDRRSKAGAP